MEDKQPIVLDVAEVLALEKRIAEEGIPLLELMQRAGGAVAVDIMQKLPFSSKILLFAGYGNNGGDAWVASFILAREGYQVTLVSPLEPGEIKSEPAREAVRVLIEGLSELGQEKSEGCLQVCIRPDGVELKELLLRAEAVVDGMLGTGFSGNEVRDPFATWIRLANEARSHLRYSLAIDTPSGLSAQTGEAANPCFIADATVTMITAKKGLRERKAQPMVGELKVAPLVEDVRSYLS